MDLAGNFSLVKVSFVHSFCRILGSFSCRKLDDAIPSGKSLFVQGHTGMHNFTEFFEGFLELLLVNAIWQVANIDRVG